MTDNQKYNAKVKNTKQKKVSLRRRLIFDNSLALLDRLIDLRNILFIIIVDNIETTCI